MRMLWRALFLLLAVASTNTCLAITLTGNGTITPKQQQELEMYIRYFGRASIFVGEYCYFDKDGNPVNKGKCVAEVPKSPNFNMNMENPDYANQFYGTPLGKAIANPEMSINYLHSFPEVWLACNNRRAFGCTTTNDWPDSVIIFLTTYDKKLGNITLNHEIEYHAKRNIKH